MKNHYVSQFIIRRFSNAINIFDVNSRKIDESKRPSKIFYKEDIYDEEIEKLFNSNIESRISNILDNKILNKDVVTLTRKEIELLKRYMLICSVRTQSKKYFCKILKGFKQNADRYIDLHKEYSSLPYTETLRLSDDELYLRTLKVFVTTTNITDIILDPLATREMLAWAIPFLESYIAFWDAPQGKEYVLTDCGMCSEYEGFHMLTGGIDISKISFLLHKIHKKHKIECYGILASNFLMYENYNIFNLSSTRSLVMINPFFKLYHNAQVMLPGDIEKHYILDEPDIWPAIIQNRNLFDIPETRYKVMGLYTPDDEFIYSPKLLTNEDLIYINSLMLSQTQEIIGFNDATKIIDSIYYFVWQKGNFESVTPKGQSDMEVVSRLIKNVYNSPFRNLCNYCDSRGGINKMDFLFLFKKLLSYIYKDFHENPYICEYYLDNPDDTTKCKQLDFLGIGEKKLETFRKILENIEVNRKNAN